MARSTSCARERAEAVIEAIGGLFVFVLFMGVVVLLTFPLTLLKSWVFIKLWGWFVVPMGVQQIEFWHAFGLLVIVNLIVSKVDYKSKKDKEDSDNYEAAGAYIGLYLGPLFALLIGWIASGLM